MEPLRSRGPSGPVMEPLRLRGPSGSVMEPLRSRGPSGPVMEPLHSRGPSGPVVESPGVPRLTWSLWATLASGPAMESLSTYSPPGRSGPVLEPLSTYSPPGRSGPVLEPGGRPSGARRASCPAAVPPQSKCITPAGAPPEVNDSTHRSASPLGTGWGAARFSSTGGRSRGRAHGKPELLSARVSCTPDRFDIRNVCRGYDINIPIPVTKRELRYGLPTCMTRAERLLVS